MAEWENKNPINYALNGESLDSFERKTKLTFEQIFELLNILRSAGAQAGLNPADAAPYSIRINTDDNRIYIRNGANTSWIYLGELEENFGITAAKIGAIVNGGSAGKFDLGLDANKPTTGNKTNDLYLATDSSTLYRWTGSAWIVALSLKFEKLLDYERYCVNRNELATSGKGKVLQLDPVTGKGNIDITGSPDRLINYEIDVQNLKDNDVLAFDSAKQKIVNKPKDDVKKSDLTVSGEANKVVKVHSDGKVYATLAGSASHIDGIKVNATRITNGQVLVYEDGYLVPVDKDTFTEDSVTTTGEIGKLVRVHSDGTIHGSFYLSDEQATTTGERGKFVKVANDNKIYGTFSGKTEQLGNIPLQISTTLKDGDVFVYHQSTNTIRNEPKNAVGQGKNLILKDGNRVLGDYNGAETVTVDVANVIANSQVSFTNHLLRMVENLYLALEICGINPGGYDAMILSAYNAGTKQMTGIDTTNVLLTSIVKNDDSIDVDHIELLTPGERYIISEGDITEEVQIKSINPAFTIQRVILTAPVKHQFTPNVARMYRSNVTITSEGKISGNNISFVTKTAVFNVARTRVHLAVKHKSDVNTTITAEVAFRNSYLEAEKFVAMTKKCFYLDQNNTSRGTTEFVYTTKGCNCGNVNCTCGAKGGTIATIRIKATGSPAVIDSFAGVFNE